MVKALKRFKAVSPIVATLLLILVAIAAAVVLYTFVSGLTTQTEAGGAEYAQTQIVIESIVLDADATGNNDNITSLYVRNAGSTTIPAGEWTFIVMALNGTVLGVNTTSLSVTIEPGEVVNLADEAGGYIAFGNIGIEAGKVYNVKVVSPTGSFDSDRVKAS